MPSLRTFRARLTLRYIAILGGVLMLFTALLYAFLSRALYSHHDAELAAAANQLQRALSERSLDDSSLAAALLTSDLDNGLVMVRDGSGALRYRSPLLQVSEPNIGLHEALVHAASHGQSEPQFFTTTLERSGIVRFICVPLSTSPAGYLQIGRPLGDVAPTLRTYRDASFLLLPIVILLASYGGWALAGRALAPVKEIDKTLQAIQASDLSRRVTVTPSDRELQQLVTTVNQTLERLERSFETIRQFSGDASHQLQTPLAVMKASLELAARQPDSAVRGLSEQLSGVVNEMSTTVADLQAFALADADLATSRSGPVLLSEICHDALEIVNALAESVAMEVRADIEAGVSVWGDAGRLKQIVLNLADNGLKYARAGGELRITLSRDQSSARLEVSDNGAGIDPDDLPHVFERFFRARGDSKASQTGAGIGLAIVKRIVDVHHGSITAVSMLGRGAQFVVQLPLLETRHEASQRPS